MRGLSLSFVVFVLAVLPAHGKESHYVHKLQLLYAQTDFENFDLALFKLSADKIAAPSTDIDAGLADIDGLVSGLRRYIPGDATEAQKLQILRTFLYAPGAWNGHEPFQYSKTDPQGVRFKNRLLSNYVRTREGNCITMPILMAILGGRIGLDMKLALAPRHMVIRYTNAAGETITLEATDKGLPSSLENLRKYLPITDTALENGLYLRALSPRETAAVISTIVSDRMSDSIQAGDNTAVFAEQISILDHVLQQYPTFAAALVQKADTYYWLAHYIVHSTTTETIPPQAAEELQAIAAEQQAIIARLSELGWQAVDLSKLPAD
ncbi:transglutaminase family protein [Nitratireductor sp. XY-223]|uniref:transglutaminase family protein n=1 Tax=Nitratireductor sp. XY-223 TaxID=2561926 RepID=UPI0010AA4525|nr:transglutaminase family protein [Nitratireductor sp. XY-223]